MSICTKWRSWTVFVLVFTWVVACHGWTIVFTVPNSKRPTGYSSIQKLWAADGSYGNDWDFRSVVDTNVLYKSSILDIWNTNNVLAVKLSAYKDNVEEAYVVFNSTGRTKYNWFDCDNIIDSSYTDIKSTDKNLCEMQSSFHVHVARTFHISRNYGGCDVDAGWLMLKDFNAMNKDSCENWDRNENTPYFLYSRRDHYITWSSGVRGTADAMVISLSMVHVAFPRATPVINGNTTIYCGSTAFRIVNVKWTKDGSFISNSKIFRSGSAVSSSKYSGGDRTTPSLTISDLQLSDEGVYTCILTNTIGTGRNSVTLNIIDRPDVNVTLTSTQPTVNSHTTIHCSSRDFPVTNVLWMKDGDDIQSLSCDKYCGGNKETPSLTIYNLNMSDPGEYTCILSNPAGRGEGSVMLTVIDTPVVNVTLQSALPKETGQTTIFCNSTEFHVEYVSWKKDGTYIQMSLGKYSGGDVNTPSLTIRNLMRTDTGEYTCILGNAAGYNESSVMLTVIVTLNPTPQQLSVETRPQVTVTLPYTTIPAGEEATIDCTCIKCPVTKVTWKKDGSEIDFTIKKYDGGIKAAPSLTIHNLQMSDTGTYTCILTNSVGSDQDDIKLTVVDNSIFRPESSKQLEKIKFWQNSINQEMNLKKIQEKELKKLKNSLEVGKKNITSFKRKKTSASDDRVSSATAGYIGTFVLSVVFGSIVFGDILKLVKFIQSFMVKHEDRISQ